MSIRWEKNKIILAKIYKKHRNIEMKKEDQVSWEKKEKYLLRSKICVKILA